MTKENVACEEKENSRKINDIWDFANWPKFAFIELNFCVAFRLVTDIDFDVMSSPSPSKSDASEPDDIGIHIINTARLPQACTNVTIANISSNSSVAEDDELGDGLRTGPSSLNQKSQQQTDSGASSLVTQSSTQLARTSSLPWIPGQVERRRRKLPEIPKNKKCELSL